MFSANFTDYKKERFPQNEISLLAFHSYPINNDRIINIITANIIRNERH